MPRLLSEFIERKDGCIDAARGFIVSRLFPEQVDSALRAGPKQVRSFFVSKPFQSPHYLDAGGGSRKLPDFDAQGGYLRKLTRR